MGRAEIRGGICGAGAGVLKSGPVRPEFFTVLQLRLSEGAGLSIILPSPHRTPWYCNPSSPRDSTGWTVPSVSECLKIESHFGISQEH